jgi:hypothetical protein
MKINLLKTAMLAVVTMFYSINAYGQNAEPSLNNHAYMLITDEDQLEEGQYLIVGYKSQESENTNKAFPKGYYALGLQQSTNNRLGILVDSISDGYKPPLIINTEIASNKNDELPFEITIDKSDDKWRLLDALNPSGYLGPRPNRLESASEQNQLRPNNNVTPLYEIAIREDHFAVMACVAPREAQSNTGRDTIRFNQGNASTNSTTLNNPVFASYIATLRNTSTGIYLYKRVNMCEFWLQENQSASFTDNVWLVKFDNKEDWERDENNDFLLVSIPQNDGRIQKIRISGEVTTGNNMASNYATRVLEIDAKGSLDVSGGTLHVAEKTVMLSDDSHSAQLKSTNGTLISNELHIKKTFRNAAWYHVSFPFDVEKIYLNKEDGSQAAEVTVNPNEAGAGKGVWAKYYNGEARALADKDPGHYNPESSANWVSIPEEAKLEANKGYQLGQNHGFESIDTLTFVSQSPAPASVWSAEEKSYKVTPHPASIAHRGWNLIGNPHTFSYHLQQKLPDYITYVYNEPSNDYIEDTEIIQPFKAFFIQTEENEIIFHHHGDFGILRSLSASPYEQIRLSITRDSAFWDHFNLRAGGNNATTGFDLNLDAHKMLSNCNPQLYSRFRGIDYAINAIPDTENSIPLACQVPAAGNYTIQLGENSLSGNITKLLLLDKERDNLITDLQLTPFYKFSTTGAQTDTARFELIFELSGKDKPQLTELASNTVATDEIEIISANRLLIISGLKSSSTLTLYDITGKKTAIFTQIDNHRPIALNNQSTGIYIVKIKNEKQEKTGKINLK